MIWKKNLAAIAGNGELSRTLASQLKNYEKTFGHMHTSITNAVKRDQKAVSRKIQPCIKEALKDAYKEAGGRSGKSARSV